MADPSHLPHLIKLLDDESPVVQESIVKELTSFGPSLEKELARLNIALSEQQRKLMANLLEGYKRRWLRESWKLWREEGEDKEKLERALSLIAEFQYGQFYATKVRDLLDKLADEFSSKFAHGGVRELADYLFKIKAIRGALPDDYYNPLNSNLLYVIEQKRGVPISLACIYILTGHRVGFDIEGINFPGHFLARAKESGKTYIVDCFGGGRFLEERDLANLNTPTPISIQDILQLECDAETIIARVLRNLVNAYKQENNEANMRLISELLESFDSDIEEP
jgi:regulator of sirC expression with transglutaminase-like and TPR domain